MSMNLRAAYHTAISSFICQKRSSGYPYDSSSRILKHFDQMIFQEFPDADCITKEICDQWLRLNPGEHPNGRLRRITPVRQLAKYMNGIGIPSYILPGQVRYVRLPDLLLDLQAAWTDGNFANMLKKYTNPVLLILDE